MAKTRSAQVIESLLEIVRGTLEDGEDVLISGITKFFVK
jgi:nucleoid DNA-binding protein